MGTCSRRCSDAKRVWPWDGRRPGPLGSTALVADRGQGSALANRRRRAGRSPAYAARAGTFSPRGAHKSGYELTLIAAEVVEALSAHDARLDFTSTGVVDVGAPVDARQARVDPPQQGLQAVAGALRLCAEGAVRLAPGRDVRQLLDRPLGQRRPGTRLGLLQQPLAVLVARAGLEAVDGQQQGAGQPGHARAAFLGAVTTSGSNTDRAKQAGVSLGLP